MLESMGFCQVTHSLQKKLKYSQVHIKDKNKLNVDFLFHLVQCFKTKFKTQISYSSQETFHLSKFKPTLLSIKYRNASSFFSFLIIIIFKKKYFPNTFTWYAFSLINLSFTSIRNFEPLDVRGYASTRLMVLIPCTQSQEWYIQ